jgi:hypothetical protein
VNRAGANIDLEQLGTFEEQTEMTSYYFVYQLMSLDSTLPTLVVSVILHTNG